MNFVVFIVTLVYISFDVSTKNISQVEANVLFWLPLDFKSSHDDSIELSIVYS